MLLTKRIIMDEGREQGFQPIKCQACNGIDFKIAEWCGIIEFECAQCKRPVDIEQNDIHELVIQMK